MRSLVRATLGGLYLAWLGAWFWVFSFGFSHSFFEYHLRTRLPILGLALLAVAVPPLSGLWVIRSLRRGGHPIRLIVLNLAATGAPVVLFWVVTSLWVGLARSTGRLAFEADEAMGNGIDFMLCVAVVVVSNLIVAANVLGSGLFSRSR